MKKPVNHYINQLTDAKDVNITGNVMWVSSIPDTM